MLLLLFWDQEKSSSGKKFESPTKSNFFPLELFSSNFFLFHIEGEVLQHWQMKIEMIKYHNSGEIDKENLSQSAILQFSRLSFISK